MCDPADKQGKKLMLDSGAFTAWSKGGTVDLDELVPNYYKVLRAAEGKYEQVWMINLDVIPGSHGRDPTEKEIADALVASDANLLALQREFGARILPVFHQGEGERRLQEVMDQASYICVSPRNDLPEKQRVKWAREVLYGSPVRAHGLATTGARMLRTVGWYSADSASWLFTSGMGALTVILNGDLVNVTVSDDSPQRKEAGKHYQTLTKAERETVDAALAKYGYAIELAASDYMVRRLVSLAETQQWCDNLVVKPVEEPGLFPL